MAVVAATGASSSLNLDQGDLEQDTAIQAKKRRRDAVMSASTPNDRTSPTRDIAEWYLEQANELKGPLLRGKHHHQPQRSVVV